MTPREAFKVGFLSRCVEEGLSAEEIHGRVKLAMEKVAIFSELVNAGKGLAQTGLTLGIPLALAAPPILGGIAGYTAGKLTDVDDTDVEEIKKRELIDEYQRQTERLRRQRDARDYRSKLTSKRRILL